MGREIDWLGLAARLAERRKYVSVNEIRNVMLAVNKLRQTRLPEAYVDGIQDELLHMVCEVVPADVGDWVYLAFHGEGDRASHMKIGVARNIVRRMGDLFTGNPLPRLWVYGAPVTERRSAVRVERALLDHMSEYKTSGEWVSVGGLSLEAADAIASSLADVGSAAIARTVRFSRVEV